MARRQFDVIDVVEVLQHWHAGRPKSVVAASLNIDPKTVRKYVAKAEAEGIVVGGPALSRAEWTELVGAWFPELTSPKARSSTFGAIDLHRDVIEKMLETNSVTTVHQRLCDEKGLAVGITSFRTYVATEFAERVQLKKVTVLRPEVTAGEEVQVDYGLLGRWFDPGLGRFRRVWAFVMVLACSRLMFVRPVLKMDQYAWVASHVAGFGYFGGVVARVVPDNLTTGVTKADLYDPKINRAFADLADYYGFLVDPARAGKPKDKPRVERPMRYIRDSFFRGREFTSEAHMQSAALTWCTEVAGARRSRALDGASPMSVFLAFERQELHALPAEPFELGRWSTPKVGADCHIKVGKTLYSVPWRLIGRNVDAKETERRVEIFVDGTLIKTWLRLEKGKQTDWSDYPPDKVAFFMRTPAWCRRRAKEIGPAVCQLVELLLEPHALHRLRSAQGVLRMADRYGGDALDAACAAAIGAGDPSYRTVKGLLALKVDRNRPVVEVPAHLHGPTEPSKTTWTSRDPPPSTRGQPEGIAALRDARNPRSAPLPGGSRRARSH
jgi:transposase